MKIGIAAATFLELQPTINFLEQSDFSPGTHEYQILITGVGSMAAAYQVTSFIKKEQPGYMIQVGVGGTFTDKFPPGTLVLIKEEVLGDLGVAEQGGFSDVFDMGLMEPSIPPFTSRRLINPYVSDWLKYDLPCANGITVNEITTCSTRATALTEKYNCEIESMEGAALHYVCLVEQVPFIQFRSVSNFITERDKSKWKLKQAIQTLNEKLVFILQELSIS